MEADIRDVLLWYDTKHAYEAKGFCGESHAAGLEQATIIMVNTFREGRLERLLNELKTVMK